MDPCTKLVRSSTALTAEIDGQIVALDVNEGICFGLNAVASRIWQIIETDSSVQEVGVLIADEYEVEHDECEREVSRLLCELVDAKLAYTL